MFRKNAGATRPVITTDSWMYDDVIKWKHFPRYWPFVWGIHRLPAPSQSQWRGALMFFFDLHPNKQLSKQSWGWWFETPWRSLWSHCMLLRQDNERLWHSCYHHPRWRHGGETFSTLLDFIQGIPLEGPVCGVLVLQRLLGLLTVEQIGARLVNGEGT